MPEAALQPGGVVLEVLPDAEVVVQHGVQDAPVQIPLQCLGQHEALAQARNGHIQRQHTLPHPMSEPLKPAEHTHKQSISEANDMTINVYEEGSPSG